MGEDIPGRRSGSFMGSGCRAQRAHRRVQAQTSGAGQMVENATRLWSPSQHAFRHVGGRFPYTSYPRRAASPDRSPARSPAESSWRTARCNDRSDGTALTPPAAAASAANSRCTAATFPPHTASRSRRSPVTNTLGRATEVSRPSARATASQFQPVRSETPSPCATARTCAVVSSPRPSSAISRPIAVSRPTARGIIPSGIPTPDPPEQLQADSYPRRWSTIPTRRTAPHERLNHAPFPPRTTSRPATPTRHHSRRLQRRHQTAPGNDTRLHHENDTHQHSPTTQNPSPHPLPSNEDPRRHTTEKTRDAHQLGLSEAVEERMFW